MRPTSWVSAMLNLSPFLIRFKNRESDKPIVVPPEPFRPQEEIFFDFEAKTSYWQSLAQIYGLKTLQMTGNVTGRR